jgi:hypothetical protein
LSNCCKIDELLYIRYFVNAIMIKNILIAALAATADAQVVLGQVFNMGISGLQYPSKFLNYGAGPEPAGLEN